MKVGLKTSHVHSALLLVLALVLATQWWGLRKVVKQTELQEQSGSLEMLAQQQETLRLDLDTLGERELVDWTQYRSDHEFLHRRITSLAKQGTDEPTLRALQTELISLSSNVEVMQKELEEVKRLAAQQPISVAKPAAPAPKKVRLKKPLTPPFTLIGLEHRGGESFLAVSPLQNAQLQDIQLLRPNESHDGWLLKALTPGSASFTLPDGRNHDVKLTQGVSP
ncbi:hypothetical protein KDX30_01050 [Pseudomonas sp. CDFA 553]|uniref:hypothetical protein n=1 Tax=Pseudomonas quasicaspiana TaxID=2829821 RepID=UPI001E2EC6D4|nr:hypothetical protein [Pseudomonas quasicaspiana]MCD5986477.1 hypothetical protein [Pseudomonas quasicaspiana]